MSYAVPFNRPSLAGREIELVAASLESGRIGGNGPYTRQCEQLLEETLGVPRALLTTSCTDALELSGYLLDLGPGDEVIVPSFSFVTTANAFVSRGARPVFADVREDTLNLDERALDALITPNTRAVVALHYGGVACDMDAILEVAERRGVAVIEDNAHGLFAAYKGRPLGSMGLVATQSFHETKNLSCGEGGALLVNEPDLVARAEIVREKGTDRSRFLRGEVDKYTWVDHGSSFLPADLLAAFLFGQLEARASILESRMAAWRHYAEHLPAWAEETGFRLPVVPDGCEHAAHLFHLLAPDEDARNGLIDHLRERGVQAVFHYLPLHDSEMGLRLGGRAGQCPVTDSVSRRLVRLPLFNTITEADLERVVAAVLEYPV